MACRVFGNAKMIAIIVNTTLVTHASQRFSGWNRGMNSSNSLPTGIFPCRISADTWP